MIALTCIPNPRRRSEDSKNMTKLGFKKCPRRVRKMNSTNAHNQCVRCLGASHRVEDCPHCSRMSPRARKSRSHALKEYLAATLLTSSLALHALGQDPATDHMLHATEPTARDAPTQASIPGSSAADTVAAVRTASPAASHTQAVSLIAAPEGQSLQIPGPQHHGGNHTTAPGSTPSNLIGRCHESHGKCHCTSAETSWQHGSSSNRPSMAQTHHCSPCHTCKHHGRNRKRTPLRRQQ